MKKNNFKISTFLLFYLPYLISIVFTGFKTTDNTYNFFVIWGIVFPLVLTLLVTPVITIQRLINQKPSHWKL